MIILSNSIAQTVSPGQSIIFDTVILKTGSAECFEADTGAARLRFKNAIYELHFNGNIGATKAGSAQIAISFDGSLLIETTMISRTATARDLNNVGAETAIKTCSCDNGAVMIVNTGESNITIDENSMLYIRRIA